MDVSLEPALNHPAAVTTRPAEEWKAACLKIERYLHLLRVRDQALRHQLVQQVMEQAAHRAAQEVSQALTELALEELDRVLAEWFAQVFGERPANPKPTLSIRGRLALALADLPEEWQDQFLRPGPWPEEFVAALRNARLRVAPDFQPVEMTPHPLDLGLIGRLAQFAKRLRFKRTAVWLAFVAVLGLILIFIL